MTPRALVITVALASAVANLLPEVIAGGRPELVVAELLPGLAIAFSVEPLGMLFAALASGLWIVTSARCPAWLPLASAPVNASISMPPAPKTAVLLRTVFHTRSTVASPSPIASR
mgnify:CR=1 FL=1